MFSIHSSDLQGKQIWLITTKLLQLCVEYKIKVPKIYKCTWFFGNFILFQSIIWLCRQEKCNKKCFIRGIWFLKSSFNYNFVCNGNKTIPNITQYSQKCILQKNSLLNINLDIEYLTQEKSGNICYYVFFC